MLRSSMQRFRTGVHARRRFFPSARHVHTPPPSSRPPPPRPPPPKYIRFATVYPFILLSIFTSLALNLSVQRTARETEGARHRAQISVLEKLLARLRLRSRPDAATARELTEREQDEIERELELVGLGRGRGKEAVSAEMSVKSDEATSWREVFLGKKGKGYEPEDDKTDWEAGPCPLSLCRVARPALTDKLSPGQSSDKPTRQNERSSSALSRLRLRRFLPYRLYLPLSQALHHHLRRQLRPLPTPMEHLDQIRRNPSSCNPVTKHATMQHHPHPLTLQALVSSGLTKAN